MAPTWCWCVLRRNDLNNKKVKQNKNNNTLVMVNIRRLWTCHTNQLHSRSKTQKTSHNRTAIKAELVHPTNSSSVSSVCHEEFCLSWRVLSVMKSSVCNKEFYLSWSSICNAVNSICNVVSELPWRWDDELRTGKVVGMQHRHLDWSLHWHLNWSLHWHFSLPSEDWTAVQESWCSIWAVSDGLSVCLTVCLTVCLLLCFLWYECWRHIAQRPEWSDRR